MKQMLSLLLVLLIFAMSISAYAKDGTIGSTAPVSHVQSGQMDGGRSGGKTLVAYFQWDASGAGATAANPAPAPVLVSGDLNGLARSIARQTGGDLFAIAAADPYPGDYRQCLDRAAQERMENARPALGDKVDNMDDYTVIFVGYPSWWYSVPMAVLTFLDAYDFSGKTVVPFCIHDADGPGAGVLDIRAALPGDCTVTDALAIHGEDLGAAHGEMADLLADLLGTL